MQNKDTRRTFFSFIFTIKNVLNKIGLKYTLMNVSENKAIGYIRAQFSKGGYNKKCAE